MFKQAQWAFALLVALLLVSGSSAQTAGRISGTVKDATGGHLPQAKVVVREEASGQERSATTNEEGYYVATNLGPGLYSVIVEQAGFKRFVRVGIVLNADSRLTVDCALETGAVSDTVTVTAEAGETVNNTSGEIARVIDGQQVTNLALNARNFTQLATLIPGAPLLDFDAIAAATNPGQGNLSINGNRAEANSITVDGGFNLSKANANLLYNNIGIDFIQEVKVQASNFSAEYGRQGGAAINVTTRSGGNQVHGSAFEFFRNDQLDARNFFSTAVRKLRFNDFGGGVGGPIIKNKFFFFGGLEFKRIRRSFDPTRRTLPSLAELNGDFSVRLRGADGIVGTADDGALRDPLKTGTCSTTNRAACFPGNIIPTARLTADGRALAGVYRSIIGRIAQYTDSTANNNATEEGRNIFNYRQELLRLDYKFNDKHSLFGRYLRDWFDDTSSTLPYDLRATRRNPSLMLAHIWTIAPTLINDVRASFSQSRTLEAPQGNEWKRETYGISYRQLYDDGLYPNGLPTVSVVGFTGFGGTSNHLRFNQSDFTISDNLTWVKSRHTLKTGLLFLYPVNKQQGRASAANIPNGTIAFNATGNPVTSNNALADLLLGNFRQYNESAQPPYTSFISKGIEAYVSDQWKVHQRLSLEFGLRYQYLGATYTAENAIANFDPALYNPAQAVVVNPNGTLVPNVGNPFNGLVRAKGDVGNPAPVSLALIPAGLPRSLYDSPQSVGPRLSFAYTPFNDNKTAVRGGVGLFYNNVRSALTQQTGDNPPFNISAQFENQNL
ncbi:MAG: carboxypeptidase regulatory-like domain-containing protein, partial [Blastocatellia bacterium]